MKKHSRFIDKFPNVSGCYIIRHNGKVLYVGQSKNIKKRWGEHHRKWFIETFFSEADVEILECEEKDLKEKETKLIKELKPIINVMNRGKNDYMEELGISYDDLRRACE